MQNKMRWPSSLTGSSASTSELAYVIRAFGGFQAYIKEAPVDTFGSNKARALLTYLLMEPGHAHTRTALANFFWPDRPAHAALNNLNQTIFMLRRALGDNDDTHALILSNRFTIQINPQAQIDFDVTTFTRLIDACDQHHHQYDDCEVCAARLVEAVDYYQGPLLDGFNLPNAPAFEEWLLVVRERLYLNVLDALQRLFNFYERCGDMIRVQKYGHWLLQLEPWHEPAHRALIRALAATGNYSAALRQFELCRKTLAEDLRLAPEPETMALVAPLRAAIERPEHDGDPAHPAATTQCHKRSCAFIGRVAAIETCARFMATSKSRLLTIVGPAGVGKSRLARHIAVNSRGAFRDGVALVDLSEQSGQISLPARIAQSLGLACYESSPQPTLLLKALAGRNLLLVLDDLDCHHHHAPFLHEIARQVPGVKLLVTARQHLGLEDEQILTLTGLESPPEQQMQQFAGYEAVQLFLATAADKGVQIATDDMVAVARICRLLNGMPRAIMLAATLTSSYSCQTIADLVR